MRMLVAVGCAVTALGCVAAGIEIGPVERKAPPRVSEIRPPQSDNGIPHVGLRAVVTGTIKDVGARHVYVLVNPLSNPSNVEQFWVQQPVAVEGGQLRCEIQLGEGEAGRGEYFLIVALSTDTEYGIGERLENLPRNAKAYSKALIVKRD